MYSSTYSCDTSLFGRSRALLVEIGDFIGDNVHPDFNDFPQKLNLHNRFYPRPCWKRRVHDVTFTSTEMSSRTKIVARHFCQGHPWQIIRPNTQALVVSALGNLVLVKGLLVWRELQRVIFLWVCDLIFPSSSVFPEWLGFLGTSFLDDIVVRRFSWITLIDLVMLLSIIYYTLAINSGVLVLSEQLSCFSHFVDISLVSSAW